MKKLILLNKHSIDNKDGDFVIVWLWVIELAN